MSPVLMRVIVLSKSKTGGPCLHKTKNGDLLVSENFPIYLSAVQKQNSTDCVSIILNISETSRVSLNTYILLFII